MQPQTRRSTAYQNKAAWKSASDVSSISDLDSKAEEAKKKAQEELEKNKAEEAKKKAGP
jgi:hypothetical protein